jgi:hypothetical protein
MPKLLPALALGAALATALPALADEATFDFKIAGLKIGAMTMNAEQDGDAYTAASRIDTTGLIGVFADFFFDGTASGTVRDGGTVVPRRFDATSKSPRALRHTRIDWKEGTPVLVSVEPPRSSAPDPAAQTGALDPVSAGFRLFRPMPAERICATTVDVFDGSRLSRLKLEPPVESGEALVCSGTFARIEGEAHGMAEENEFPFTVTFRRDAAGRAQLQRIEAPTNFGQAVFARRG